MSEASERVGDQSELPLFPLSVVLFPGTPRPLHIFEPRYRRMLDDIDTRGNLFGISYFDSGISTLDVPPEGHVGCVAEVKEKQTLPDGRSNIMTVGLIRYRVESYVDSDAPYLVGKVSYFEDEAEDEELLTNRAREVSELFLRIANAVRTINDERTTLPQLPETEPEQLSYLVAAAMEIDLDVKQELLELRHTSERLERLSNLLSKAVSGYEERARSHVIARHNGHSHKKLNLE